MWKRDLERKEKYIIRVESSSPLGGKLRGRIWVICHENTPIHDYKQQQQEQEQQPEQQ